VDGLGVARCVYLTNGASLSGFTLTNGLAPDGAAVWADTNTVLTNCVITDSSASGNGGGAYSATAKGLRLDHCVLGGNSAQQGGGAWACTLNNCLVVSNSAAVSGGGTWDCAANNCTIVGNSAGFGGGGIYGTLNNCIVYLNTTSNYFNSIITLNYCCTTPLPATGAGNIAADPVFRKPATGNFRLSWSSPCINAGSNVLTPPGPDLDGNPRIDNGTVDIGAYEFQAAASQPPYFLSEPIAQTVAQGSNATFTSVADGPPPLGYQWNSNSLTIPGATNVSLTLTNVQLRESGTFYSVTVTNLGGATTSANAPLTVTPLPSPPVAGTHYVNLNNPDPEPPYTNWATAARAIQWAVDVAVAGDEIVVTNGVYASGGRAVGDATTNRVAVDRAVALRSVSGPGSTLIDGLGMARCVYLTNGASLSGFTLTNGVAANGAGIWCESTTASISNCILAANSASAEGGGAYSGNLSHCTLTTNSAQFGGGAESAILDHCTLTGNRGGGADNSTLDHCQVSGNTAVSGAGASDSTLNNCALTDNSASYAGGGEYNSRLFNCTLAGNSAGSVGGGASFGNLQNCIVYFNSAPSGANYDSWSSFSYSCTTPNPGGQGDIALDPGFVDLAGGNLRLGPGSPCIDAGNNAVAPGLTDLDDNPRMVGGSVDIGAFEFQGSGIAPYVVVQPASQTAVAGDQVTLNVTALGTQPIGYVWSLNGSSLSDATNSSLTLPNVQVAQSGIYTVTITNFVGSVTSSNAVLIVYAAPPALAHYVNPSNPAAAFPYTNWAMAALNIQDAIDSCVAGDEVVVTNGLYATGGRTVDGSTTNRVVVAKPVTVRSVNGPQFTLIQGGSWWEYDLRCVYMADGATLSGFTLTNGFTSEGAGAWCESTNTVLSNCVLVANFSPAAGGGVYQGTLNRCGLIGNGATNGGGAYLSALNDCALTGTWQGGAALNCTLNRCFVTNNTTVGAIGCTLNNCLLANNQGEGADSCTLNNCTVTGNSGFYAGGALSSALNNCIVYFNSAEYPGSGPNYYNCTLTNCCTLPLPSGGGENITNNPLFLDAFGSNYRLQSNSSCINAGNNSFAPAGSDLGGNPRIFDGTVDIGAYEFEGSAIPISPYITSQPVGATLLSDLDFTFSVVAGGTLPLSYQWGFNGSDLLGATTTSLALKDLQTNQSGRYSVRVANVAGSILSDEAVLTVTPRQLHYVDANSPNPTPPFSDWTTAAHTIQDAVDAANTSDKIVVTNGIYATGGRADFGAMTNRVAVDKAIILRSVNGPQFTAIQGLQLPGTTNGDGAIRCVYMVVGADLVGFTLTNGATRSAGDSQFEQSGGGVFGGSLYNCILAGNSSANQGGAAYSSILNNCTLSNNAANLGGGLAGSTLSNGTLAGNRASIAGGGAYGATLYSCLVIGNSAGSEGGGFDGGEAFNCTLVGNTAPQGGGAHRGLFYNSIIYFNNAPSGPNYDSSSTLYYCCATPNPYPPWDIALDPAFVDLASGNLRLQSNSPCIDRGDNFYAGGTTDLDGRARIVGGTVDMGSYEFQPGATGAFIGWLGQYGLPTDGSADYADSDGDGMNNWQEWVCGTNPTNAASVLRVLTPVPVGTNLTVSWQSALGIGYFLQRTTNLAVPGSFIPLATNLAGQAGVTSFTDTNAVGVGPFFYRVRVGN
jgi:hypothetical protein